MTHSCLLAASACFDERITGQRDDILDPAEIAQARAGRSDMLASHTHRHHTQTRLMHAQGHVLVALLTCSLVLDGPARTPAHIVCHFQDITDRAAEHDALAHQLLHDPLTGIPNRLLLFDRIEQALQRSDRQQLRIGLLFCDLDHFKAVNDTFGHAAGDQVLTEFTHRLQSAQRRGDTAARLAGDEFIILCQDHGQLQTAGVIARIQQQLAKPFIIAGRPVTLTVSIGAAIAHHRDTTAAELIRAADEAMYTAKRNRRH